MGKEKQMKYEFHVGDYVETKDGWIGYVNEVYSTDNSLDIVWTSGNGIIGKIVHADWELLYGELARIGQYDFTKRDEGKIEPLCEEYTKSFPIYKTTTTGNDSEWRSIDIGAVGKKINELIEVVNELRDKND